MFSCLFKQVIDMIEKQKKIQTIDEYIESFDKDIQAILQKIRSVIKKSAPDSSEAISYGIPTFRLNGNLVHFAAFKNHIGFYPTPSGIEKFKNELMEFENAKGSVRFPLTKPIPYDLIRRIVEFRVQETLKK